MNLDPASLLLLAIGLSMDVFSVSAVTGFGLPNLKREQMTKMALSFGLFHIFMPIIGWFAGSSLYELISGYDHWAAFLLLAFVGGKMLLSGVKGGGESEECRILEGRDLLMFSVAVSIDSVAVGLSFGLEQAPILVPALVIGFTAFVFTYIGVQVGCRGGAKAGSWAELAGGLILVGIGLRVLLSHIWA